MNIRLFSYEEDNWLKYEINDNPDYENHRNTVSSLYAQKICDDIDSGENCIGINIHTLSIDDRANRHVDKWVEETSLHMNNYSSNNPLKLAMRPGLRDSENMKFLKIKSLSGDISGVIGEALFSSILTDYYNFSDTNFVHYGADRKTGIFPDFGIYEINNKFERDFPNGAVLKLPLAAEVKAVSDIEKGKITPQLRKATDQISNFQAVTDSFDSSALICVVLRNFKIKAYDVAMLRIS